MRQPVKLAMALLFAGEGVFFFMLVLAFVIFRSQIIGVASETLNFPLTSIYTACLLVSSLSMWRATRSIDEGEAVKGRFWLTVAIVLGAIFLLGQDSQYLSLLRRGATMSRNLFGTTFFTLAGMHEIHLALGIVLLLAALRIAGAAPSVEPAQKVQAVAAFWYFGAGLWIVIFSVVYLWTFL
jgi:cytochrome c oxidase subunit III